MDTTDRSLIGSIVPAGAKVPSRFDLRFGEWVLHVNLKSGKLGIFRAGRPDLAHLVIAWGTRSRELDVHLTFGHEQATAEGRAHKDYISLVRIPLDDVERLGEAAGMKSRDLLIGTLFRRWRRFRPGWLARNGYVVGLIDPKAAHLLMTKVAPKQGRKFRVQVQALEDEEWVMAELGRELGPDMGIECYDAHVLHAEDVQALGGPIQAMRKRDGKIERVMLHQGPGPGGKIGWWGFTSDDMVEMNKPTMAFFDWLVPHVRPEHLEKFETVARGLGLDESEAGRKIAAQVRQFLRAPRNPVRAPYPLALVRQVIDHEGDQERGDQRHGSRGR